MFASWHNDPVRCLNRLFISRSGILGHHRGIGQVRTDDVDDGQEGMVGMVMSRTVRLILAAALLSLGCGMAAADTTHDQARRALESGEILPLRTILERIERDYPGQVLEVELERKDSRWLYEIKVLQAAGMVVKLKVNAQDGNVLSTRTK